MVKPDLFGIEKSRDEEHLHIADGQIFQGLKPPVIIITNDYLVTYLLGLYVCIYIYTYLDLISELVKRKMCKKTLYFGAKTIVFFTFPLSPSIEM